ncbi:hypothetical protein [Parasitella parasitica]|uniref:LIM zinc-binding domain-containing protein n=1 Tax=Parasitella parasitica TaxID=35722 RepID=A0A0B7N3E5_9FUNG|nr:hypothetical protein [Parasitella parasitica]
MAEISAPIINQDHSPLSLFDVLDYHQNLPLLPSQDIQKRSKERSNALNNSIRRIFQKNKVTEKQHRSTDSPLSPTLSLFSSTSSNNTIPTPRSSEEFFQHYLLTQEMNLLSSQRNNHLVRSKSAGCKKPVTETAALQKLVTSMSIKDDLCQHCSKYIADCDNAIKDPITKYSYHQSCYCCSLCRASLTVSNACEHDGKLYCARDYQVVKSRTKLLGIQPQSPKPMKTKMFMSKSCFHCKLTFKDTDTNYKIFKNRIYCNADFRKLFLPKCPSCHKAVEKEAVSAIDGKLQGKWHIGCFNCQICHAAFPDNIFYIFENRPYCKTHYHYLNNSLCNRCHQGIENRCAHTAEGWRFHPKCFSCEVCRERLNDTYYVFEDKIYCETHIRRQYDFSNNEQGHPKLDKRRTQIYDYF